MASKAGAPMAKRSGMSTTAPGADEYANVAGDCTDRDQARVLMFTLSLRAFSGGRSVR